MKSPFSMASKAALPPGSMVYVGRPTTGPARVSAVDYDPGELREVDQPGLEQLEGLRQGPGVTWVRVAGVHDVETVEKVGSLFGLHPLTLEDIVNTGLRPKLEEYDHYLLFCLKSFCWDDERAHLETNQVCLVLGDSFVLEFSQGDGDPMAPVLERIRSGRGRIRKRGAGYLAYALVDVVVDGYFALLDSLSEEIDRLEEDILGNPDQHTLAKLHLMKRSATKLRHQIWPLREAAAQLVHGDAGLIGEDSAPYWRDLYDHVVQILDMTESLRENLSSLVDIYLNTTSQRMNEIMKVLTIIATIFIPLTFLAGVYGMNFKYMPELEVRWAYPVLLVAMLVVVVVMLLYFRRKKWLGGGE